MLLDLYQSLHHFKREFSRQQAWLLVLHHHPELPSRYRDKRDNVDVPLLVIGRTRLSSTAPFFFVPTITILSGYGLAGIGGCCPMRRW